jgi:hypothetical protein
MSVADEAFFSISCAEIKKFTPHALLIAEPQNAQTVRATIATRTGT